MKKGLTLAEVLLGIILLAFAFVSVLALFASCVISNESNRNLTVALSHAQFAMEEIKNTNFLSIAGGDWDWDSEQIGEKGLNALMDESITTTITGADLLNVTIVVDWHDRGGRDRSIELKTLIAEP